MPVGLPVFPGAQGFGTTTPAGRGGAVIEVTSLADSGPGTLRDAVATPGPRTIVFRVGGTLTLEGHLEVYEPFVTIAGQTAPGDGILINGAGLVIFTHDVLIQHLRIRPGGIAPINPEDNDALAILGAHGELYPGASNVVIDHVSLSWSEDEIFSAFYGAHDVTLSWSIASEALNLSRHEKGTHSAGVLMGDGSSCTTQHHNLYAHNDFRNPLLAGGGLHDVQNNLIYDWGTLGTELSPLVYVTEANLVRNLYIPGPSTPVDESGLPVIKEVALGGNHPVNHFIEAYTLFAPAGENRIYAEGNIGPSRPSDDLDEFAFIGRGYGQNEAPDEVRYQTPFQTPRIDTVDTSELYAMVLEGAGAVAPRRDPVDTRIVSEVQSGGGSIIDNTDEVGGFPVMNGDTPPDDVDHDGMPDSFEIDRGLNPDDPSDGPGDDDGDGYTNLEEYLHTLSGIATPQVDPL